MTAPKGWIIEGKYTTGRGSEWEEIDEVSPTDTGGPGDALTGREYAYWLCREYQIAAPAASHRVRAKR
jgi:hypothetical protein